MGDSRRDDLERSGRDRSFDRRGGGGARSPIRRSPSRSLPPRRNPSPRRPVKRALSPPQRARSPSPPRPTKRERSLSPGVAAARLPVREKPVKVYVSQLPLDMDADELNAVSSEFGTVVAHEIWRESTYKCGWIEYPTKKEASAVVEAMDKRTMEDW